MPHYTKHTTYWRLLGEVLMQGALNTAVGQITIDIVQRMPVPDLGTQKKALAARSGGVLFGMSLFARQTQWKLKFAALAAFEDRLFYCGLPQRFLARAI